MLTLGNERKIYLRPGKTDFRKSVNGLSALIQDAMLRDPFDGSYFVFCNRTRDRLKIMYYDRNGFCLWYKRLEEDKFRWPKSDGDAREMTRQEFEWLLAGLDFHNAHKFRNYSQVS